MSLSVAENVGTDGGDRMLKSPRAPLVSVTCSSNLLRRVQWRKNEKHEAQQLSHWLMFQKSSPGGFFSPFLSFLSVLLDFHNCLRVYVRTNLENRWPNVHCALLWGVWCWRGALEEPAHCISAVSQMAACYCSRRWWTVAGCATYFNCPCVLEVQQISIALVVSPSGYW